MDFDPYSPPQTSTPDEAPVPEIADAALDARRRMAPHEANVSAVGVLFYVPVLWLVFVIWGFLRGAAHGHWPGYALALLAIGVGALIVFGAQRLRQLRRDGRMLVSLTFAILLGAVLATGILHRLTIPFAVTFGYWVGWLWIGSGAAVFRAEHAAAVAATRTRPVPTATWGWTAFGIVGVVWAFGGDEDAG